MTVSFLFGWQHILTGLVLLIALAALFLLLLGAGRGGRAGRSEWRAYLDGRSPVHPDVAPDEDDAAPDPASGVGRKPTSAAVARSALTAPKLGRRRAGGSPGHGVPGADEPAQCVEVRRGTPPT